MQEDRSRMITEVTGGILIWLTLLLIFWPLIVADSLLAYDDMQLISPLLKQPSFGAYFKEFLNHRFLDIQPVRDVSYLLDIRLKGILPFWSHHLSNLIIWCGSCLVYWRILAKVLRSRVLCNLTIALVALHPTMALSVSWIAARKHLLSSFFIGMATWFLLEFIGSEGRRRRLLALGMSLAYSLGLFSHPIGLLWPLWALLCISSKRDFLALILPSVIMLIGYKLNWDYYLGVYTVQTGATKVGHPVSLSIGLLALGRYLYNLILPEGVTLLYDPGSGRNVIGLCLLPLMIWVFLKTVDKKKLLTWGAFFLFPLAVVIERQNNVFVSDSYLPVPMLGFAALVALAASGLALKFPVPRGALRLTPFMVALLLGFFAHESRRIARAFGSDAELWEWVVSVEKTPFALSQQAFTELQGGNDEKALYLAQFFYNWQPRHSMAPRVLALAVSSYRGWTDRQKLEFLEARPNEDPWYRFYLAGIYSRLGRHQRAWECIRDLAENPMVFEDSAAEFFPRLMSICRSAGGPRCDQLEKRFPLDRNRNGAD